MLPRRSILLAISVALIITFGLFNFMIPLILSEDDVGYEESPGSRMRVFAKSMGKTIRGIVGSAAGGFGGSSTGERIPADDAAIAVIFKASATRSSASSSSSSIRTGRVSSSSSSSSSSSGGDTVPPPPPLVGDDLTDLLLASLLSSESGDNPDDNFSGSRSSTNGASSSSSSSKATLEAILGAARFAEHYFDAGDFTSSSHRTRRRHQSTTSNNDVNDKNDSSNSNSGSEIPSRRLQHDVPALFVTSVCRHWESFSKGAKNSLRPRIERAAEYMSTRVTPGGLYDIRVTSDATTTTTTTTQNMNTASAASAASTLPSHHVLAVSTLRQVEATAALRCAGKLLDSDVFLSSAERLRRGLFRLYAGDPSEVFDGAGPFDLGAVVAPRLSSSALAASITSSSSSSSSHDLLLLDSSIGSSYLDTVQLKRVRGLTSDLPLLLLFLEHRDVPAQVIQELAEASTALASPLGVKSGRDLGGASGNHGGAVGAAGVGAVYSTSAPWRVTPIEQAAILIGCLKHMLPLQGHTAGSNMGDELGGSDYPAADALGALVDIVLRIAPALSQLEHESASRASDTTRQRLTKLYRSIESEVRVIDAKRYTAIAAILQRKKDRENELGSGSGGGGGAKDSIARRKVDKLLGRLTGDGKNNKNNKNNNKHDKDGSADTGAGVGAAAAAAAAAAAEIEAGIATSLLETYPLPVLAPSLRDLANASDALAALKAGAFIFTFPEHLTLLGANDDDELVDPRATVLELTNGNLLKPDGGSPGHLYRTRLSGRFADAGRNDLVEAIHGAGNGDIRDRLIVLAHLLGGMRYPENGLAVVRPREAVAVAAANSKAVNATVSPVEHVVLEVASHNHHKQNQRKGDASGGIIDDSGAHGGARAAMMRGRKNAAQPGPVAAAPAPVPVADPSLSSSEGSQGAQIAHYVRPAGEETASTLLVRGDGHPVAITTAIAARFFRRLYETAFIWLQKREEAAKKEAAAAATGNKNNNNKKNAAIAFLDRIADLRRQGYFSGNNNNGKPTVKTVNAAAMQLYLQSSGSADVTDLTHRYRFLVDPSLSKWRQMTMTKLEAIQSRKRGSSSNGGGNGEDGGNKNTKIPPIQGFNRKSNSNKSDRSIDDDILLAAPIPPPITAIRVNVVDLHSRICGQQQQQQQQPWFPACCEAQSFLKTVREAELMLSIAVNNMVDENTVLAPLSTVPTFTCNGKKKTQQQQQQGETQSKTTVSCAYVLDDFCDCEGDGADEIGTAACGGIVQGAAFKCTSGVLQVSKGKIVSLAEAKEEQQQQQQHSQLWLQQQQQQQQQNKNQNSQKLLGAPSAEELSRMSPAELADYGYIHASKVGDGIPDCVGGEDEG